MPTITTTEITKIADLSKLEFSPEKLNALTESLDNILRLVKKMDALNTANVLPLAHPLNITQPMREDIVTEKNQRDLFQQNAPSVEAGLYIVPKYVEE